MKVQYHSSLGEMANELQEFRNGSTALTLRKDEAFTLAGEEPQLIDPAVEARVLRKIDRFLIPAMTIGCQSPFC